MTKRRFHLSRKGGWIENGADFFGQSERLMDAFLEIAVNIPFRLNLHITVYPRGLGPTSNTHLCISHLHITSLVALDRLSRISRYTYGALCCR